MSDTSQAQSLTATPNPEAMRALGAKTQQLTDYVPRGSKIAYIDYPMHINVGDLLIFLGTMDFFEKNDIEIAASFCLYDANERAFERLEETDVIVCHGGGNFGDIYPAHQTLREEVIKRYPDKPVIIFPQSIQYGSRQALETSAAILRQHKNLTICVRDQHSHDIASTHFTENVLLTPDMAHRLYDQFALVRNNAPPQPKAALTLLRRDVEAPGEISPNSKDVDWRDLLRLIEKIRIARHLGAVKLRQHTASGGAAEVYAYAATIHTAIMALANRICRYDPWRTNRLHGAIFGLLLDRNMQLEDNSYGKISRYFELWGKGLINTAELSEPLTA